MIRQYVHITLKRQTTHNPHVPLLLSLRQIGKNRLQFSSNEHVDGDISVGSIYRMEITMLSINKEVTL